MRKNAEKNYSEAVSYILPRAHKLLNCRYLIVISQKQNPTLFSENGVF
jgi:hypothetical protein